GEVPEREYEPSVQQFAERVRQFDTRRRFGPSQSTLYLDTGAGFNEHETVERHPARTARFRVEYDLGAPGPEVKALRWDPLEGRSCRVRLERVTWTDGAGVLHEVRPGDIGSNGTVSQDGTHVFTTLDPMFLLPVRGSVSAVRIEGEWWIDDAEASLAKMERALAETGR